MYSFIPEIYHVSFCFFFSFISFIPYCIYNFTLELSTVSHREQTFP